MRRVSENASDRKRQLVDPFGRAIRYLRLSVTDRCDFRCTYCMPAQARFLPRHELLALEELDRLCAAFIARGVRKLRLTGGEPLTRRGVLSLFRSLSRHLDSGALDELTLTTNGGQLDRFAGPLAECGVRRVNVSLDTLDADRFRRITRGGSLPKVLAGVAAARAAGLKVKINAVAQPDMTEHDYRRLIEWAHGQGMDVVFIEVMPLGEVDARRQEQYLALDHLRARLARFLTLVPTGHRTSGPAHYLDARETGGRVGFIAPHSCNFCDGCDRVRVTSSGRLHQCLGHEGFVDLREPLRASAGNSQLDEAIVSAIARKPRGHEFDMMATAPGRAELRFMNATGG